MNAMVVQIGWIYERLRVERIGGAVGKRRTNDWKKPPHGVLALTDALCVVCVWFGLFEIHLAFG